MLEYWVLELWGVIIAWQTHRPPAERRFTTDKVVLLTDRPEECDPLIPLCLKCKEVRKKWQISLSRCIR